ncbi:MAG: thioredoxin-disulfide reductase [Candidatus Babeliales bacterium]
MNQKIHNVIIIGSGPAGLTAGVYTSRANLEPLIIEGGEPGGQLMGTTYVENWPGEKSILGPTLMKNMREHAQHTGCTFKSGTIERVDFSQRPFKLITNKQEELFAHTVIIATGATPKRLGVPGEEQHWGKGVTTCAVCDGAFYKDKPVLIVGGGDTAMEDASFMLRYTNNITIVQISDSLTASAAMQKKVVGKPGITILYNSTVKKIIGDGSSVSGAVVVDNATKKEKMFDVNAVFVAIGLHPNTAPFKDHLALEKNGYIKVSDHTKTSVEGVFVAGDVADYRYRQAITSAGVGCMAALDAQRFLEE